MYFGQQFVNLFRLSLIAFKITQAACCEPICVGQEKTQVKFFGGWEKFAVKKQIQVRFEVRHLTHVASRHVYSNWRDENGREWEGKAGKRAKLRVWKSRSACLTATWKFVAPNNDLSVCPSVYKYIVRFSRPQERVLIYVWDRFC